MPTFRAETRIPAPAGFVFEWHTRPGAFQRLSAPGQNVELVSTSGGIEDGARVEFLVRVGPVRKRWVAVHQNYVPGRQFQDVQVEGPFARWTHTHRVIPEGPEECRLEDEVEYALPLGAIAKAVGSGLINGSLERAFAYRHRVTIDDIRAHWRWREAEAMKVLVSGSSGLVGSALVPFLTGGGHEVVRLVRSGGGGTDEVRWDPRAGTIDRFALEGVDAVVHLAGENIAAGRWTARQKEKIRSSRVQGTRLLAEALAELSRPPRVMVCASAIGYYGDRGDEVLTEESPSGDGFLAEVCREWEAAAEPARSAGIRVVHLRFGVILSGQGGALAKMLLPFKMGVGGVVGSGRQWMSWIALDDAVGAVHHALMHDSLTGAANGVAPEPVTNREFTNVLGRVLHRPTIFPLPAFAARIAFGEMADALLLSSSRVLPVRLAENDYDFRFPKLEPALRHVLGRG